MQMDVQVLLPGEQVMPLPKSSKKNKNNKNKPNGFISFANAQRKHLAPQFDIRSQEHLVQMCDPMWRKLTPHEKSLWNTRAKDEHARGQAGNRRNGVRVDGASSRMDCNGKIIAERVNAERSTEERRQRERKFVCVELDKCEEIVDLEFCIIDCLTAIDYTDGECVPCEIGVVKASIREGLIGSYHFFPDPGSLRPGFIAEAQIRTETVHEVPYEGFHLASTQYEEDAQQLLKLIKGHAHSPKTPLLFCRSSEYKYVQSCLDWLGYRVSSDFNLQVMELESFCVDLVAFTKNEPPTFAQIRRLLFETRYDFQAKTRCEFHSLTDKANCAIGNVRKYFFFLSELLYDYYEFELKPDLHYPIGFKRPKAAGSSVCTRSEYDFDDGSSVRSEAFSVSSFVQQRAPYAANVRQLGDDDMSQSSVNSFSGRGRGRSAQRNTAPSEGFSQRSAAPSEGFSQRSAAPSEGFSQRSAAPSEGFSQRSAAPSEGFSQRSAAPSEGFSQLSLQNETRYDDGATVPRRPIVTKCYKDNGLTYDTHKGSQKSQNSFAQSVTPPPRVNSFSQSSISQETRSQSPVRSIGRGSSPVCGGYSVGSVPPTQVYNTPAPPGFTPISPLRAGGTSLGRGRGRGVTVKTELPRKPHSSNQKKDKF